MTELLTIHDDSRYPIDGRELHQALGINTAYKDWFPRMCEYGFLEGMDYCSFLSDRSDGLPGKPRTNHKLTLSMGKELCMIQRSELGRKVRRYLIAVEDAWNTPEQIMTRALRLAEATIGKLNIQVRSLAVTNAELTVDKQIMAPKAEYFDQLVDRNMLTSLRDTAKALGVREKPFIRWLMERKYLFRDQKGKLLPFAGKGEELFEVKECFNEKTSWTGVQTMVTPKGRETFRLLVKGLEGLPS